MCRFTAGGKQKKTKENQSKPKYLPNEQRYLIIRTRDNNEFIDEEGIRFAAGNRTQ